MSAQDLAGRWLRVSTGDQSEANQVPDVDRWIADHGYALAKTYALNGKSAFHGKQDAALDTMFADMSAGRITVLVVWAADRIERRGALAALTLAERARQAGGRIEYVHDAHLNATNEMSDVMLALAATMARQESQRKSDRVKAVHQTIKSNGALQGRPPWGYVASGNEKYAHTISPTGQAREIIPELFARCIAGESLSKLAAWLDTTGAVPPTGGQWHPKTVNQLLRCRTYAGHRTDAAGVTVMRCESVVDAETFERAGVALSARFHRGALSGQPAMLAGILRCANCDSPMYRIMAGKGTARRPYYRCAGTGRQRKGCGVMISLPKLDAAALAAISSSPMPWGTRTWQAGTSRRSEIKLEIRGLDLDAPDYAGRHAALMSELASAPLDSAGHWAETTDGTTLGEHFAKLDQAGRVEFLRDKSVTIYAAKSGELAPGMVVAPKVQIVSDLFTGQDGHRMTAWSEVRAG